MLWVNCKDANGLHCVFCSPKGECSILSETSFPKGECTFFKDTRHMTQAEIDYYDRRGWRKKGAKK